MRVGETPIQGLYEVVISGKQIIYTDAQGNYMIVGDLIDINSRKSLTDMRAADLNKIDFASLPLDKAIKEVRGRLSAEYIDNIDYGEGYEYRITVKTENGELSKPSAVIAAAQAE